MSVLARRDEYVGVISLVSTFTVNDLVLRDQVHTPTPELPSCTMQHGAVEAADVPVILWRNGDEEAETE